MLAFVPTTLVNVEVNEDMLLAQVDVLWGHSVAVVAGTWRMARRTAAGRPLRWLRRVRMGAKSSPSAWCGRWPLED